jgi:gliding motility-associated-like protein
MKLLLAITCLVITASHICGQNYSLNGDAIAVGTNCIAVTPNQSWQNGSVWYTDLLDLSQPFTLEFQMNYGSVDANGADGMMFVLQTVGPNALGEDGAGMGFEGFNPSFGIEFDTYYNSDLGDISADHVAFQKNGGINHSQSNNLAGPVVASPSGQNIEDGQEHPIKITWNPVTRIVQLYFDCVLRLSAQVNLVNSIFNGNTQVWWGFTGATGGLSNAQLVCLAETYEFNDNLEYTICQGESVQISANGNPDGNYSWLPATGLSNSLLQSPVASPAASTEYCYTYTDICGNITNGCIQVDVIIPPEVSAGPDGEFCSGSQFVLQGECNQSDAVIQWTNSAGDIISTGSQLNPSISSPDLYTVTATSAAGLCSSSDIAEVIELPLPTPDFVPVLNKCVYDSALLDVGNSWQSVLWFDGSANSTFTAESPGFYEVIIEENNCELEFTFEVIDIIPPDVNLGADIQFCEGETAYIDASMVVLWNTGLNDDILPVTETGYYSAEMEWQGCFDRDTIYVEEMPLPVVNANDGGSFCAGSDYLLGGSADQLDVLFDWTLPSGAQTSPNSSASLAVNAAGTYTLTAINTLTGCAGSDEVELVEIPLPIADFDLFIEKCSYDETTLDAGSGWESVQWFDGSNSTTLVAQQAGTYPVTISQLGCVSTFEIEVEDIIPPSVNLGLDREMCFGDSLLLNAGFPVEWSNGILASNLWVHSEGDYYALSYSQGCFVSDTVNVQIAEPPSLNLMEDTLLCEGSSLILQAYYTGIWSTGETDNSILVEQPGTYTIRVTQGPCVAQDSVVVTMLELPYVSTAAHERYCEGDSYELAAIAENSDYYSWSTGDSTASIFVTESIDAYVTVGNACGTSMSSVEVVFEDCSAFIYMPTSFTPNGDGINDEFWPVVSNVISFEISIYDRWGRTVFHSNSIDNPWLGNTSDGQYFVPNGQYNYRLICTTEGGNAIERSGYITVIR